MKKLVLTPAILKDEAAVSAVTDEAFAKHPAITKASHQVQKLQAELRQLVPKKAEAWRKYLAVEESVNARAIVEMDLLIAWAFEQGRAFARREARGRSRQP